MDIFWNFPVSNGRVCSFALLRGLLERCWFGRDAGEAMWGN